MIEMAAWEREMIEMAAGEREVIEMAAGEREMKKAAEETTLRRQLWRTRWMGMSRS